MTIMKKLLLLIALIVPFSSYAKELIQDFEWLEPNNAIEIVIGEPYQLHFSCSNNSLAFTSAYADSWVHIDFTGGQHVVDPPTGYSIDENGVIIGSVCAKESNGTVYIGKLMVHPDHRRSGYGARLLAEVEQFYPGKRYELFTSSRSIDNIKLYRKSGYKEFARKAVNDELQFVYMEKK